MSLQPFNIVILDPDEYIQRKQILPVSTAAMFEPSTERFHPDGLFSEVIFGKVGSSDRIIKRGYIDLNTEIVTPHLYKQLLTLKGYYKNIASGKMYARFDEELKDMVPASKDDPDAHTGYAWFISQIPNVEFKETGSTKRSDKIALLKKYQSRLRCARYIVLPAGIRDVKFTGDQPSSEEINKLYVGLLALAKALPPNMDELDELYDPIRYQIQCKVQAIYDYICDMMDDKGGFAQARYSARGVAWSTRNVITSVSTSNATSPDAPNATRCTEMMLPLYQAMKSAAPLVVNKLKTIFFDQVFSTSSSSVAMIDPKTYQLNYYAIDTNEVAKYTSSPALNKLIDTMGDKSSLKEPFAVRVRDDNGKELDAYLYLIYDDGDRVCTFRNLADFENRMTFPNLSIPEEVKSKLSFLSGKEYFLIHEGTLAVYFGKERKEHHIAVAVPREVYDSLPEEEVDVRTQHKGKIVNKDVTVLPMDNYAAMADKCRLVEDVKVYVMTVEDTKTYPYTPDDAELLSRMYYDKSKIRPMTWIEIAYIATYGALRNRYTTATRYPVLNFEGLQVFDIHLQSTLPSRIVTLEHFDQQNGGILLPEYPRLDATIKMSCGLHPATLEKFDGRRDCRREVKTLL